MNPIRLQPGRRFQLRPRVLVLLALSCVFAPLGAGAQEPSATVTLPVPVVIPLTGVVKASGDARAVSAEITLSLYADRDDPIAAWVETQTVALDADGRYSVQFGSTRPDGLPAELFAAAAVRWVGVAVDGAPEGPRMMLLSVAYAANAAVADSLGGRTAADFVLAANLREAVADALARSPGASASLSDAPPTMQTLALDGGGTANTIVKFLNGSGTLGDSVITESSGSIGIGKTPAARLDVAGQLIASPIASGTLGSGLHSASYQLWTGNQGTAWLLGANYNIHGLELTPSTTAGGVQFSTPRVALLNSGYVGIGKTTPISLLDVAGTITGTAVVSGSTSTGVVPARVELRTGDAGKAWLIGAQWNAHGLEFTPSATPGGSDFVTPLMTLRHSGRVGIGTIDPGVKFHVAGDVQLDGNVGIGAVNPLAKLHVAGNVAVDGNIAAKFQDVAEWVESGNALDAGTLVVIDTAGTNRVSASARAYDSRVAGAISAQPGVVLGEGGPGRQLVAQSGRVRIKADARFGAIRPGDLLVSSPTAGHAMRSRAIQIAGQSLHRPGTLIGKALEALPAGRGEILVLLTLQ